MAIVRLAIVDADIERGNGTALVFTKPPGTPVGALIQAMVIADDNTRTITADDLGWTLREELASSVGGSQHVYFFERYATSGDPSTWGFTMAGGATNWLTVPIVHYSDSGGQIQIDDSNIGADATGPALSSVSFTPIANNCEVLSFMYVDGTGGLDHNWTHTSPAGSGNTLNEALDFWTSQGDQTCTVVYETQTTATNTSHTSTHDQTHNRGGVVVTWSVKEVSAGQTTDAATAFLDLQPSGTDEFAGTFSDAATGFLDLQPSGTEFKTGLIIDAGTGFLDLQPGGFDEYTGGAPPPVTPPIVIFDPYQEPKDPVLEWKVVHYNHDDEEIAEFKPENLNFAKYLSKVGDIAYDIDMSNPYAKKDYLYPKRTDYRLFRGMQPLVGGMHTAVNITDLESNQLGVVGNDWLHYFEERHFPFDPEVLTSGTYLAPVGTDVFTVIEDIIEIVLAEPESLSLSYALGLSGQTVNQFKIDRGDTGSIFDKISSLSKIKPGFDFEITYDRIFKAYAGGKGSQKAFVFETGKNAQEFSYTNNGPNGTHTLGLASGTSARMGVARTSGAANAYRRLDASHDYPDVKEFDQLEALVEAESERDVAPRQELSFKYVPEQGVNIWDELDVGDSVKIHAEMGYDEIDDYMRIVGMQCAVDAVGGEEIVFTVDDGTLSL